MDMSGKRKAAWLAAGKNRAPAEEEMPRITGDEEPDELEEALKGAVPGAQELSGEREEPMESCPDCERSRCFSCIGGKCVALTDNDFGHRGCPFFKPFEQARREQKACFRRLVQRGRVDLIFKYRKFLIGMDIFDLADEELEGIFQELQAYEAQGLAGQTVVDDDDDEWE